MVMEQLDNKKAENKLEGRHQRIEKWLAQNIAAELNVSWKEGKKNLNLVFIIYDNRAV